MKKYILVAGVNGAGKSTLHQTMQNLQDMPRINIDEIVQASGDWRNVADVVSAGKIAVKKMAEYFEEGVTFNQETTLCGKSVFKNIKKAKKQGYYIELHYIGVEDVDIAKKRVSERVRQGGHGIPEKDIERRYVETFHNLKAVIPDCDLVVFYDNTEEFRRFAVYQKGMPIWVSGSVPKWFKNVAADQAMPISPASTGKSVNHPTLNIME